MSQTSTQLVEKRAQSLEQIEEHALSVRHIYESGGYEESFASVAKIAHAMDSIRGLMTKDLVDSIAVMQNSPLGFMTDKEEGYKFPVLRDVLIEASILGYFPVNNEFNVIARRFYPAKNGLLRKCRTFPGVQNYDWKLDVPKMHQKGATVGAEACYLFNGKPVAVEYRGDQSIAVRLNAGMGADGALGKAERKLHARILAKLLGIDPDIDAQDDVIDAVPIAEQATETPAEDQQLPEYWYVDESKFASPKDGEIHASVAGLDDDLKRAANLGSVTPILESRMALTEDDPGLEEAVAKACAKRCEEIRYERSEKVNNG